LEVELKSEGRIFDGDGKAAEKMIHSLFNLDLNLDPFYADIKQDRNIRAIVQRLRGLRSPTTATAFEALVSSIIEQQISRRGGACPRGEVDKDLR
jgi:3-methyladenine DNA glycosylase/8-oxoguanine DNA glycosylase